MGWAYQIKDQQAPHFLTFQVINWVDVFTRNRYKDIIVESLNYCVQHKGLKIYGWVIMSNHLHLIVAHDTHLSDVVRDFKKFTSKAIIASIKEMPESRRQWMLFQFSLRGRMNRRNDGYQFWTHENHAIQLMTAERIDNTLNYIHENPVRAGLVTEAIYYPYSSAMDYADMKGLVKILKV
jgi:REP element-mobilizing transposase RayT